VSSGEAYEIFPQPLTPDPLPRSYRAETLVTKLCKPFFWYRILVVPGGRCMSQPKKSANPKVTIIASKGANQAINYLLEDRDELEWLVAIGRNHKGDIFFYDTGGDIIQDLGALEYIKERILRDYFGETDE
jgi:hypothetical protein